MPAKRTDVTTEKCKELFEKYKSVKKVAKILNCGTTTVRERLKYTGAEIKPREGWSYKSRNDMTKQEQAHYICTVLREELAEFIVYGKVSR